MPEITLRPYQEAGVADIRAAFSRKEYPVLFVLPTGGGKTYTFSYIASKAAEKDNSVCIIVHRKELLLQASKSLRNLGIDHGLISPHFTPAPHKKVQVASVDTLKIRIAKQPDKYRFKLVIFDEAHHVTKANKWGVVYELMGRPIMLGVTATPVRGDGTGLGEGHGGVFKSMVIGPLVGELIAMGMLINPEVFTSLTPPDLTGLSKNKDGDYNMREVESRVDKPVITGSAVAHYKELCPGARTIVFCTSIKHAKHVVEEFNAAGYRFALLVGEPEMSDSERTEINRKLAAGELDGACTVDLVSEGYDLPDLECCIMLRPTASESLFLQQVGRVMRPAPGKTKCYLLDHVANVGQRKDGEFKVKHGLPDAAREWSLEGRKKKKKGPAEKTVELKQCPECYHVFEPAPECPKCGHDMRPAERKLEQVDGQLQQITPEMAVQLRLKQRAEQASAQGVQALVELGYSRARAEKIEAARREKREMIDNLIEDLRAWREKYGDSPLDLLGVTIPDIRSAKPKQLKDLRERFDAHREAKSRADAVAVLAAVAQGEIEFNPRQPEGAA